MMTRVGRKHPQSTAQPATAVGADCARLVEAWRTAHRVTTYLVEQLSGEIWTAPVPGMPRKRVCMVAAHLHNSRCSWIKALGQRHGIVAPPLVDRRNVSRAALLRALRRSSDGMIRLLKLGAARGGHVPPAVWQNFPTDLEHFVSYFVAHEAHHRGQLVLITRQLGYPLSKEAAHGLWHWTRRRRE